ncbi:MAG: hypothetical protein VYE54_00760, partial [Pseudomonadota bacterium]|nr:hypothetical protein [Pseudomonadota bacterium]
MVVMNDYMGNALSLYKTDYVSIVCDVLPSDEWQAKENINKATKLPGAQSFNSKEHFKNGVRFAPLQSHGTWVKVQACPSSSKGHQVRIAFNFYTPEGLQYIRQIVDMCIPIGFEAVIAAGLVTRLD